MHKLLTARLGWEKFREFVERIIGSFDPKRIDLSQPLHILCPECLNERQLAYHDRHTGKYLCGGCGGAIFVAAGMRYVLVPEKSKRKKRSCPASSAAEPV